MLTDIAVSAYLCAYALNLRPLENFEMTYTTTLCIILCTAISSTYDHRVWKTGLPVRSAVLKPHAGELVVGWVTTSESSLLYVFAFFLLQSYSWTDTGVDRV
jgi:hypothetical protein